MSKLINENSTQFGAVAIACNELNRECIGIELDEDYYNIAYNRINGYTYK